MGFPAIQNKRVGFAFLLSFLEALLYFAGRAVDIVYGLYLGALLIFGINLLFLLSEASRHSD